MFRVRFQTILIVLTTAVLTIFLFEGLQEKVETWKQENIGSQVSVQPAIALPPMVKPGITIRLPKLTTTTVNTVVSVPDGGTFTTGRGRKFVQIEQ